MADAREGWGEKIKSLRIASGMSQEAITKKIAPGYFNIMSGAETEIRAFSPEERTKFFLAIKQPMDSSIPVCSKEEVERRKIASKRANSKPKKLPKETPIQRANKVNAPKKASKVNKPVERLAPVNASSKLSQVKQAALDDIAAIILRPTVTDTQTVNIVNLFKSLAISVVLQ